MDFVTNQRRVHLTDDNYYLANTLIIGVTSIVLGLNMGSNNDPYIFTNQELV